MPNYHLISHELCPYVQRAVIALTEKRVPFQRSYVDRANKPEWFRRISPLGKAPVLQVDDEVLFESAVICDYLDEVEAPRLHPAAPLIRARHRAWIEFASTMLNNISVFCSTADLAALGEQLRTLVEGFETLDGELAGRRGPYFAGTQFTLVDAAFAPVFRYFDVFDAICNFHFFETTPNVLQWRKGLAQRPSVQDAVMRDYPDRLRAFILKRDSALARLTMLNGSGVANTA